MKTPNEILKWLKANLGRRALAPLTSTDTYALVTSVNLSNLIGYDSAPPELFKAYHAIVSQMQEHNRHLAFHAIAMELDWGHRAMIWCTSGLVESNPVTSVCCFEAGGGGEERSKQLQKS